MHRKRFTLQVTFCPARIVIDQLHALKFQRHISLFIYVLPRKTCFNFVFFVVFFRYICDLLAVQCLMRVLRYILPNALRYILPFTILPRVFFHFFLTDYLYLAARGFVHYTLPLKASKVLFLPV